MGKYLHLTSEALTEVQVALMTSASRFCPATSLRKILPPVAWSAYFAPAQNWQSRGVGILIVDTHQACG